MARLKPDGTLDGDFGKAGKVTIDNFLGTFHQETSALVIDANGKLVVAGRVADELPD